MMTALKSAATGFLTAMLDAGVSHWVTNSKVPGVGIHPVVGGFIDDRFDSQRRRQEDASTRQTWP